MYAALNSPIAAEAVERIDALYTIEREIRGLDPEARLRERQVREVPLLDKLHSWLTAQLTRLAKSSALARAIRYTIKPEHWPALTYYCTDGRADMDNNAAERSLRDVALGRRYVRAMIMRGVFQVNSRRQHDACATDPADRDRAAQVFPRVAEGLPRTVHNQRALRNCRSRSDGRNLAALTCGARNERNDFSFIARSASTYMCVVAGLSCPSHKAITATSTPA